MKRAMLRVRDNSTIKRPRNAVLDDITEMLQGISTG
jgi:hypothetical protein